MTAQTKNKTNPENEKKQTSGLLLNKQKKSCFTEWYNGKRTNIGSFERSLYDTYIKGSSSNKKRIREAFKEFFNDNEPI